VLNAIYEEDFLGFSYGFRPKRSQHDALDALCVAIDRKKVRWILDVDIRSFFDQLSRDWLVRFLKHRIADKRMIRLVHKWLQAGVLDEGVWTESEAGVPQGATISPLLANIYLYYVFDLWAERWRKRHARGSMIVVRYADDIVCGFEHEAEARRFMAEIKERFKQFDLTLHDEKTRLLQFGRFAAQNRAKRGMGKPETFNFLGFTHICGCARSGAFLLKRKTRRDRMRAKLKGVKEGLRRQMHGTFASQGQWLHRVYRGYCAYHAVPTNLARLRAFRHHISCVGGGCYDGEARKIEQVGRPWPVLLIVGCRPRAIFIPGPTAAFSSNTQGGSRVRESRPLGSVRGVRSNVHLYRSWAVPAVRVRLRVR
jgi:group II intron reverse transcriptase/maturase